MSENSLLAKIKADAAQVAADVKKESESQVSLVEKETEEKLSALRTAHEAALIKQHKHLALVATSRAKQSGKIALQQAKRDQIDAVFAEATAELVAQPTEQYVSYFSKLTTEMVPRGVEVVVVKSPKNREAETKDILKSADLNAEIEVDSAIAAGLVIETKEGVFDITLDRLINENRAELEMEVVKFAEA